MKTRTQAPDANEFCLVLTPTASAPLRASEAIRHRFEVLTDEVRRELAALVGELVEDSVVRDPRRPVTVTILLGDGAIRGEVSDGKIVPFEIPLTRPA